MKKLLTFAASTLLFMSLIGCDESTGSKDVDISGKWAGKSMTGIVKMKMVLESNNSVLTDTTMTISEEIDTTMLFNITGDKIYMYMNMGTSASADTMSYSISGSTITIHDDDGTDETSSVSVSGSQMTMTMQDTEIDTSDGIITTTITDMVTTLVSYSGTVPPSDWPEIQ